MRWALPGIFNARNAAMAACAAGLALSPGRSRPRCALDALARFRAVRRRQEVRASTPALTVIEDFGHHPTALAETLGSLRARYPGARLAAAFEPRSNTARTRILQDGFARALAQADEVYLGAVSRAEAAQRGRAVRRRGGRPAAGNPGRGRPLVLGQPALCDRLMGETLPPQGAPRVVVFFSNGSFDGIIDRYAAAVKP